MNRLLCVIGVLLCVYGFVPISSGSAASERQSLDSNEQIIADCTRALNNNPNDANAYLKRGNAFAAKDYPEFRSLEDYKRAIALKPDFVEAYLSRGFVYEKCGNYDNALTDFTKAIELDSRNVQAYFRRGNVYMSKKKYDSALTDYNQVLAMNHVFAEVYLNRGNIYFEKGDSTKAIADYSQAIKLKSAYAKAYYNRGNVFYLSRKYDQAITDYDKAIAASRLEIEQHKRQLLAIKKKEKIYNTITLLEFMKLCGGTISPEYSRYYNNRGLAYYQLGKYDEAIRDFSESEELDPSSSSVQNAMIARLDQAIAAYTKKIAVDPHDADTLFNRGNLYYQRGKYYKAIADFTKTAAILPSAASIYANRANCFLAIEEYDQAFADIDKAIELDSKDANYYFNRAGIHFARKEYDKAIADYAAAIAVKPNFAPAYNNRHNVYEILGRIDLAIADLQKTSNLGFRNTMFTDNPRTRLYFKRQVDDNGIIISREAIGCIRYRPFFMGNIMKQQLR